MNFKHGCTLISDRGAHNPKWRAYIRWVAMRRRCLDPENKDYPNYGGRGITLDPRWSVFANFLEDMGEPPTETTIERDNNEGSYCKANCRWATRKEQSRNKRNNRYLEYDGKRMLAPDWAVYLGVKPRLIRVRLSRGWSVERTLSTPVSA